MKDDKKPGDITQSVFTSKTRSPQVNLDLAVENQIFSPTKGLELSVDEALTEDNPTHHFQQQSLPKSSLQFL